MKKYSEPKMDINMFECESVTAASGLNDQMSGKTNGNYSSFSLSDFFNGVTTTP